MNNTTKRYLMAAVAALGLGTFAFLYGWAIVRTFMEEDVPGFKPEYVWFATSLAGVVGGVAVMAFQENKTVKEVLRPHSNWDVLVLATTTYVIVYMIVGIAAIVAWLADDKPPDLVKNLALIAVGLLFAVIRQFMGVPAPKDDPPKNEK